MAGKIVRLQVGIDGRQIPFFFDREFEDDKTNQENCDNALAFLVSAMRNKDVLAFTEINGDRNVPAIINLATVTVVLIQSAKVYELKNNDTTTA